MRKKERNLFVNLIIYIYVTKANIYLQKIRKVYTNINWHKDMHKDDLI